MLKHNGEAFQLNAGDAAHDEIDRRLEVEIALDRIDLCHASYQEGVKAADNLMDLISVLEAERLELQGAEELMTLLRQMRHE